MRAIPCNTTRGLYHLATITISSQSLWDFTTYKGQQVCGNLATQHIWTGNRTQSSCRHCHNRMLLLPGARSCWLLKLRQPAVFTWSTHPGNSGNSMHLLVGCEVARHCKRNKRLASQAAYRGTLRHAQQHTCIRPNCSRVLYLPQVMEDIRISRLAMPHAKIRLGS